MNNTIATRRLELVAALAVAIILGGCGGGSAGEVNISEQPADLVTTGAEIYQAACAACHGTDLRGTDQGPSHLSAVYEPNHHSDAAFLLAVRNGSPHHHWRFGDMKPIDGLSEEDIVALTAFVREKQRVEGFEPYPP
jgi:mono/diheme cytochrome c family protein